MIQNLERVFRFAKKFLLVIFVYFIIANLFLHFFSSNENPQLINPIQAVRKEIYKNIHNPKFNSTKEGKKQVAMYKASMCFLIGEACTNNPRDGDKNYDRSFFGYLGQGVVLSYKNPPASASIWLANGLQSSGLIPKSYASQGIGFGAIQPISGLWKIFRDVALGALVLVFVTIGFFIMFRVKINPQVTITIENSLPRIVFTLIMIVFSFPIAGFLIDLMYVVTALGISILNKGDVLNKIIGGGTSQLFDQIFWNSNILDIGPALFSILPGILGIAMRLIVIAATFIVINRIQPLNHILEGKIGEGTPFISGLIAFFIALAAGTAITAIIAFISPLILSIIILVTTGLYIFFRLFFLLLASYIRIIISVIFSPVILLANTIPGKNTFILWLKTLISDLIAFPITAILVVLSAIIAVKPADPMRSFWQPPFLYSAQPEAFNSIISIGILFLIPDLIKKTKEIIGIKPTGLNIGIGTFLGASATPETKGMASGLLTKFSSIGYAKSGFEAIKNIVTGGKKP